MQQNEGQNDGEDTNRHVDVEDQLPTCIGDDVAAQCWAKRGSQQGGDAKETHGCAALLGRKFAEEQGDGEREQGGSSGSLDDTEQNENGQTPGDAAECRANRKGGQGKDVEAFDAKRF